MRTVHGGHVSEIRVPRLLAAGLGAALQAADALVELGAEGASAAAVRGRAAVDVADRAYRGAARRGDLAVRRLAQDTAGRVERAANDASAQVGRAADAAAGWTERQVVRRVARSLTPYLIDELVPEVIDGVLPKIRTDVVPVVVEDLAGDARIRAMVAQQSRGMLTWSVTEVRRASAEADDRVETSLRRLLGRRGPRP
jgi:hypothetical protein